MLDENNKNAGCAQGAAVEVEAPWYLVYTRPRLESLALDNLRHQGFEAYLPLYKRLRPAQGGMRPVFEPLFSRYVFFRPSRPEQSVAPVRSTLGVAHLVRFGHELATIAAGKLQAIRLFEQQRSAADVAELSALRPGDAVRFSDPALKGLEGLVKSVSSQRVTVLFELMGREQVVRVEHHQVQSA